MSRTAYVNGTYQPLSQAAIHVEDRGFLFGDGIYEVWGIHAGRLMDFDGHMARLERSLDELKIARPMSRTALGAVLRETVRRNRIREGLLYLEVTRGSARRDHAFPDPSTPPSVVAFARSLSPSKLDATAKAGIATISQPDIRWGRCDIKTVNLLPNVLAKQAARESGAAEALLIDDMGLVTEGAAANVWIVDKDGKLRTRDIQANILRGITREGLKAIAQAQGLELEERAFSLDEVKSAREVFISSATTYATPVVSVDGFRIGDGKPGPVALKLRDLYLQKSRGEAI
jgi:Branched-chain amino acid aminotransferase/4-amino-4-deoxychorismate lyase